MRTIRDIQDVLNWGLCIGCGACFAYCNNNAVKLVNIATLGIRPQFSPTICSNCSNECLAVCPGFKVIAKPFPDSESQIADFNRLLGTTYGIWQGCSSDPQMRHAASSGGILSALAIYCLENEGMSFVVHTGMNPEMPWHNRTVISKNRDDIMTNAGSRYAPSSPCELFRKIEESDKPCVFIGKPCDVAAINMARQKLPRLDEKLGLVLSFFCAGTPSTEATVDLLTELEIGTQDVKSIRYRGQGWPGNFSVQYGDNRKKSITYMEAWSRISKKRPFRCHICPDSFGQLSDIASGDAWSQFSREEHNEGLSHILVRSQVGREILSKAHKAGYIAITNIPSTNVIQGQGLIKRKKQVFGRLLAMFLLGRPYTRFKNFHLFRSWIENNPIILLNSVFGTIKRMLLKRNWRPSK